MRQFFLLALILALSICSTLAQPSSIDSLVHFKSAHLQVYHSKGRASRANEIVPRVEKAMTWYANHYGFRPRVRLLILTETDWPHYTSFPVYGDDGSGMKSFFDLLALHELGHAFHFQAGLQVQRLWMGELLVNMMLHCYVAEQEPEQLAALTLFPRLVVIRGSKGFPFHSLQQLQDNYELIGKEHPYNYAWYQCRWHKAAAELYDAYGCELVKKTWNWLKQKERIQNDEALIHFFEKGGLTGLADLMRNW